MPPLWPSTTLLYRRTNVQATPHPEEWQRRATSSIKRTKVEARLGCPFRATPQVHHSVQKGTTH